MSDVKTRWFITVEWCKNGHRGIFCDKEGNCCVADQKHTDDEMAEKLGPFWLILDPQSTELTMEQLQEYKQWYPLAEYSHVWGIALKQEVKDDNVG